MLDRHADVFADRNLFLQGVLGALSLVRQLDQVLLSAVAHTEEVPEHAAPLDARREAVLLALLGAISLRHTLADRITGLAVEPPPPAAAATDPPPHLGQLLR